jgi:hypothetical protein
MKDHKILVDIDGQELDVTYRAKDGLVLADDIHIIVARDANGNEVNLSMSDEIVIMNKITMERWIEQDIVMGRTAMNI